jgi:PQQ-dependent dehydrogenase (methanol/ethanol family)
MRKTPWYAAIALSALLAPNGVTQSATNDWPTYSGDLAATRFSPLAELTKANVSGLRRVCTYDTGETTAFQTGPVVVQGVIYFTSYDTTFAIDASTCALKWKHSRPVPKAGLAVNRGLAFADGKVFRGAGDAHVFALDASNGQPAWDVAIGEPANGDTVPMAPIAWNGMVFVGNAGGDNFGVTGRIYALSAADGHQLWRFNVVPDSGPARDTWKNVTAHNPPTGGATWTTYSLDAESGVLWVSTGNVAPDFMVALHPGDNLYTTSVLALDAKTGKLLGYVQPVKKDFHDWDMTAPPALIRTRAGRMLAAAAGKAGLLYGIDRSGVSPSGEHADVPLKIVFATPITTRSNVTKRLTTTRETRFCPGTQGGTEWNGPGFSPSLNLLFVNAIDWCTSVKVAEAAKAVGKVGDAWSGSGDPDHPFGRVDPKEKWGGWLTAVDADTGKVRWKYKSPTPMVAGVTPTAGGLVFTGDLNGDALALDAENGKVLWRDSTAGAIGGGVVSYQAGGHQRIAVAAGMSARIWPVEPTKARIVVYGLP